MPVTFADEMFSAILGCSTCSYVGHVVSAFPSQIYGEDDLLFGYSLKFGTEEMFFIKIHKFLLSFGHLNFLFESAKIM